MDAPFGPEPAPIAHAVTHAIKLRDDFRVRVAAARETTFKELQEHLLAKLAPLVRDQVLRRTTVTANDLLTEEKLLFIARGLSRVEHSGGCTRDCLRANSRARAGSRSRCRPERCGKRPRPSGGVHFAKPGWSHRTLLPNAAVIFPRFPRRCYPSLTWTLQRCCPHLAGGSL